MSRDIAETLFARLRAWLEKQGVKRGPNVTELQLGRLALKQLGRDEPLLFITGFYLPAVYGHGPRITAEEAERLVDALAGPVPKKEPAGRRRSETARRGPSETAPAGTEEAPAAEEERSCLRCGGELA